MNRCLTMDMPLVGDMADMTDLSSMTAMTHCASSMTGMAETDTMKDLNQPRTNRWFEFRSISSNLDFAIGVPRVA